MYITEDDLSRAAAYVKLPVAEFEAKYVVRTKNTLRLRKPQGAQCHFLRDTGCSIHPVKPVQCRLFPFWPELVENRADWDEAGQELSWNRRRSADSDWPGNGGRERDAHRLSIPLRLEMTSQAKSKVQVVLQDVVK